MTTIYQATEIHETPTGRTRVRYDLSSGFSMVTQDQKSGVLRTLPIDPEAIDALVAMWPVWKSALPAAAVPIAAPETPSPPAYRAGQAATSSSSSRPASSPPSTMSGSGAPSLATERASAAPSSPAVKRDLFA